VGLLKRYYLLLLFDLLYVFVILICPKFIVSYDGQFYVATANNIINYGKFFSPLPNITFPIGYSLILSPALIFLNNTLRITLLYCIHLLLINGLWIGLTRFFNKLYSPHISPVIAAIICLSPGILYPYQLEFYSETVFTICLLLAFISLCKAVYDENCRYWITTSLFVFLSYTIRSVAICIIPALLIAAILQVIIFRRKPVHITGAIGIGGLMGLSPLIMQKISLAIHDPQLFIPHYQKLMQRP